MLGTQRYRATAHYNAQLFPPGEERAIAEYAGIMADARFPQSPELLRQISKGLFDKRQIPQGPQGGYYRPPSIIYQVL